ncbi:MAG: hypothetical protein E7655_04590 [Ruminococcaceae bacterium]|nr:hypothetical protein [Oscillospiraceae bacterium]
MKKNIFIGIFSPLLYFLINNLLRYTVLASEYNEKYAMLVNALLVLLPALPGVALIFLLRRCSVKDFYKSLGISFWVSVVVFVGYILLGIDPWIYNKVTGFEELGLGDGFITALTMIAYLISCVVGSVAAGILTFSYERKMSRCKQ